MYITITEDHPYYVSPVEAAIQYPNTFADSYVTVSSSPMNFVVHTMVSDANGELVEDTAQASAAWYIVTQ